MREGVLEVREEGRKRKQETSTVGQRLWWSGRKKQLGEPSTRYGRPRTRLRRARNHHPTHMLRSECLGIHWAPVVDVTEDKKRDMGDMRVQD